MDEMGDAGLHLPQVSRYQRAGLVALWACALGHAFFIWLFWRLGSPGMAAFNVASVALYAYCLAALPGARRRQRYTTIGALIVGELVIHAMLAGRVVGPEAGFQYYSYVLLCVPFFVYRRTSAVVYARVAFIVLVMVALEAALSQLEPLIPLTPDIRTLLRLMNLTMFLGVLGFICAFSGREQVKIEARMEQLATTDFLTGVLNRRKMSEMLERALQDAERSCKPFAVALMDIDYFKQINDRHGHDLGDEVIRRTAARIRSALRPMDECARWGGEEFLVLLRGSDELAGRNVAERIRRTIESAPMETESEGETIRITVSCGIAALNDGESLEGLLQRADEALYAGKHAGRNQVVVAQA